ncbi:hypothetical protein EIP91_009741 [Steccherinum ochraceum]|uniref:Uncharacterized protein n=1 Tax=Steccherinum ochraceum TaxID=92696 RepID=A0A4R0R1A3_9APHY|nr:hypothetical protein EIP91_009741 [Steccherinum ochraceum]
MLRLSEAGIIATALQGMLYGIATVMFILTMVILFRNSKHRRVNYTMVAASCALTALATAEIGVNISRLVQGLLDAGPMFPSGIEGWFADVSEPTFIAKSVLYNAQTLILDAVVIYRAYAVWQRAWIVVIPVLSWMALFATASTQATDIFAVSTGRWITLYYSLTLATNLTATSILAYRIWRTNRRTSQLMSSTDASSRLTFVLLIVVIESGAIYSMAIIAALVLFVVNSPGVYVILDLLSPIICIVFHMIIVRIGLATEYKRSDASSKSWGTRSLLNRPRARRSDQVEGKPIQVEVELDQFDDAETSISAERRSESNDEDRVNTQTKSLKDA